MTTNSLLFKVLGVPADHQNSFNWHNAVVTGFPATSFQALAQEIQCSDKQLAKLLNLAVPGKREVVLTSSVSERLYRITQALSDLLAKPGFDVAKAKSWLTKENSLLRSRVPLDLLGSSMGCDYVITAISRS